MIGGFTSHYSKKPAQYCHNGVRGLFDRFTARRLRVIVSIWRNDQAGITSKFAWTIRCDTHGGQCVEENNIRAARERASDSPGWCTGCEKIDQGKGRAI